VDHPAPISIPGDIDRAQHGVLAHGHLRGCAYRALGVVVIVACALLFILWVLFNLLAGYAPLMLAERISPGRLPAYAWWDDKRVRFYVGRNVRSYAFNVWAPPFTAIVFDRDFFEHAGPDLFRFVVAHELGHARWKHHIRRWFSVVTGAALLPAVRRRWQQYERDADTYAEMVTGLPKSMFPQLK
jgi:hypothetical protein